MTDQTLLKSLENSADGLWTHLRLTRGATGLQSAAIDDAAIYVVEGRIAYVGSREGIGDVPPNTTKHDGGNAWVTAGLID